MNIFQSAFTRAKAFVRSASGLLLPSGFAARQADEQRKKEEAKDKGERWQSRAMRSYMRRLARWKRKASMRIGGPVLTGKRLERARKSCCPANLLVQPRHRVTLESVLGVLGSGEITKTQQDACTCGRHKPVPYLVGDCTVDSVVPRSAMRSMSEGAAKLSIVPSPLTVDEILSKALQPVGPA